MYNLDEIFTLYSDDEDQAIIKVNANSPLMVARYPFVSGEYEYITVTKSDTHILTIVKKDGSKTSFHWGAGGCTCISESLRELKTQVQKFLTDSRVDMGSPYYFNK